MVSRGHPLDACPGPKTWGPKPHGPKTLLLLILRSGGSEFSYWISCAPMRPFLSVFFFTGDRIVKQTLVSQRGEGYFVFTISVKGTNTIFQVLKAHFMQVVSPVFVFSMLARGSNRNGHVSIET